MGSVIGSSHFYFAKCDMMASDQLKLKYFTGISVCLFCFFQSLLSFSNAADSLTHDKDTISQVKETVRIFNTTKEFECTNTNIDKLFLAHLNNKNSMSKGLTEVKKHCNSIL